MNEGLKAARFLMLMSSISPLFVLWGMRGNSIVPEQWFLGFCALMVLLPNGFLWWRIRTAKRLREIRQLVAGKADDHRDHLFVYLFAMLLPFYAEKLATWRDVAATLTALGFIVFLFWHLNLHYMNIVFAWFNYRVFTIYPTADGNSLSSNQSWVLITKRAYVAEGDHLNAYRISDTVYLEVQK